MKSVMGEESQNAREDAFNDYLIYYQQVWPQGNLSLCQETEVAEKARRFLLTETNPDSRFTVFGFYRTVSECVTEGRRECRDVLKDLVKATEVLEMLCVNLFLFPWKKEIKTLKTFTGPFVYWIKPVLPQGMVKSILESIGYRPETDMEYRLDANVDPGTAARMGFELFLARQECEYLLEVMGQSGCWEFDPVLMQRFPQAPLCPCEASEGVREDLGAEPAPADRENTSLHVSRKEEEEEEEGEEEEELDRGHSLVDPGEEGRPEEGLTSAGAAGGGDEGPEVPRSLEFPPPNGAGEPVVGPARSLLTDDGSIREMREHYPDLTFRQKPVFGEPAGPPAGQKREKAGRRTPKGGSTVGSDLCAAPSVARLPESRPIAGATAGSPKPGRRPPDDHAQEKEPAETETCRAQGAGPRAAQGAGLIGAQGAAPESGQASADECLVSELAERMGQMTVKEHRADAELKYPVEETAWQDARRCRDDGGRATPLGSPRDKAQPVPCHPSQVPQFGVPGCRECSPCDAIKEPPQSYYIPPPCDAMCAPSQGHAQQPEEELLETYVLVEREQKEA
ncbi:spermatogenesis-associated protein 2-like protein [Anguilla rostrata]|uniref:spermatogenesis-associated protein 2-like protein n=1 Tax=Anguilla rostrata TaxID=7938 RepID=UPI0030D3B63A